MKSLLYLPLLFLTTIYGQVQSQIPLGKADTTAALQINETKLAIDGDTTLTMKENKEEFITSYYKNDVLIKIVAPDFQGGRFGQQSFYLLAEKLIYYERNYYNMSRMGSCGGLDIKTCYYFLNDKIISQTREEFPYECYNDPFLTEEIILSELKRIRLKL